MRRVPFVCLVLTMCLGLLPAMVAAQEGATFESTNLYLHSSHTLSDTIPTGGKASSDKMTVVPGGGFQSFPAFRSAVGLGGVADSAIDVKQAIGGAVVLYIRSNRKLEDCVDFALELRGGDAVLTRSLISDGTLRRGMNQVAWGFGFDETGREMALATDSLTLILSVRLSCGMGVKLTNIYDSRQRPSSITFTECLVDEGQDDDGDGIADICEVSIDLDGIDSPVATDECPSGGLEPDDCPSDCNPDQADGDGCDTCENSEGGICPLPSGTPEDADGDGVLNAEDNCTTIPNPDQIDENENGVGDVCECTLPAPGRCIGGGGSRRTDCLLEINTPGPVRVNRAGTGVRRALSCQDGDSACDRDGLVDGQCTFGVSLCFANTDPRFRRCTPRGVGSVEVLRPAADRAETFLGRRNGQLLEGMVGGLGLEVRRGGWTVTKSLGTVGNDVCSSLIELAVPAPNGSKPLRREIVLRARAIDTRQDRDRLTLICHRAEQ